MPAKSELEIVAEKMEHMRAATLKDKPGWLDDVIRALRGDWRPLEDRLKVYV